MSGADWESMVPSSSINAHVSVSVFTLSLPGLRSGVCLFHAGDTLLYSELTQCTVI